MKHFLFLFLTVIASFYAKANNDAAIAYNDKIVNEQTKIGETILSFSGNPNEFSLTQISTQVQNSIKVLNSMKALDGNKDFLDAAKALFKFYASITKNEYKKILVLLQEKNKYSQEELVSKIDELTNSISSKERPLDKKFQAAQAAFAQKYGFTLTKNKLEDKIKNVTEE
ncbi:MAG: hypothetical protein U0T69_03085 [Chitinophagales bacterium]